MAKARIKYEVDSKELDALQKQLAKIQKQNEGVEDSFEDVNKEVKKTGGALTDLKGAVAGIGLAALATQALVEFAKLSKEINKNRKETALLTGETGKALDSITAKIRATSQVFDKEYNEVLRSANAVSKQLGITMTESMDGINDAMSRGLDINGEYLETIREYSPFMKQAGIDFNQFNILIQKQLTDGVFSDKGIDAIKEAVISIQEMTPATRDALKAVGLNTNQLIKDIESGAKTYFEVIQDVGRALEDVTDPRVRGQVLADVFRGAGEDAGEFALTLHEVGTEYGAVTEEQQKYIDSQVALITATEATQTALVSLTSSTQSLGIATATLWERVKAATLRGVEQTINLFQSAEDQVESFQTSLTGAGKDTLGTVFDDLIRQNKELNKDLAKSNEIIAAGGQSPAREIIIEQLAVLDQKIQIVNKQMTDLAIAEKDEAGAALIAAEAAKRLAEAKEVQAEATERAAVALRQEKSIAESATLGDIEGKPLDLESKIVDEKLSLEEKLKEDTLKIRQETSEAQAEIDARDLERQQEKADATKEIVFAGLQGLAEITSGFANLRIQQISQELTALEFARNRELELAEGNAEKEAVINAKFDAQKRELQKKQANTEKANALFSIAINTAIGIASALKTPLLIPVIAAIGAAQAALVLAQPIPQFAEGVLQLDGKGTGTSDSIHAMLSKGETVITAQNTNDYYPTLKAIHNNEISPDVLNQMVLNGGAQPNITVNDYDKLAKALLEKPEKNVVMDENGFTGHIVKKAQYLRLKQSKYKM